MRITLTIEDDVAARLEQIRAKTGESLKSIVNSALRAGVQQQAAANTKGAKRRQYTRPVSLGNSRVGSIVSISETLAIAEGEDYK